MVYSRFAPNSIKIFLQVYHLGLIDRSTDICTGNIKPNRARGESNVYLCTFQARKPAYSVSAYHTHIGRVTIYSFLSKSTQMRRFANICMYVRIIRKDLSRHNKRLSISGIRGIRGIRGIPGVPGSLCILPNISRDC